MGRKSKKGKGSGKANVKANKDQNREDAPLVENQAKKVKTVQKTDQKPKKKSKWVILFSLERAYQNLEFKGFFKHFASPLSLECDNLYSW